MASRLLLLGAVLVFLCITHVVTVSSDADIEDHQSQTHSQPQLVKAGANRKLLPLVDCGGMCEARCRLHSRPKVCTRACGTCCMRCKCVPPGTSGNREMCGTCYTDMTTHANRTKCP